MIRKVTVADCFHEGRLVPMIRLRGLWLQAAGFKMGQRVEVVVEEGKLVLAAAPPLADLNL